MLDNRQLNEDELANVVGGAGGDADRNFSIKVINYTCPKQIIAKLIKEITNIGHKEAQELVDSIPKVIKEGITSEEANIIFDKLASNGIEAEIIQH